MRIVPDPNARSWKTRRSTSGRSAVNDRQTKSAIPVTAARAKRLMNRLSNQS